MLFPEPLPFHSPSRGALRVSTRDLRTSVRCGSVASREPARACIVHHTGSNPHQCPHLLVPFASPSIGPSWRESRASKQHDHTPALGNAFQSWRVRAPPLSSSQLQHLGGRSCWNVADNIALAWAALNETTTITTEIGARFCQKHDARSRACSRCRGGIFESCSFSGRRGSG